MIHIRPALDADAAVLLPVLRPQDHDEIIAATGEPPSIQIPRALERSGSKYTAHLENGQIIALYGIADTTLPSKIGSPWLLGSTHIDDHIKAFLRTSQRELPALICGYDYLVNMVDARNTLSKKWLGWLGFTIREATPYGPYDMPFHKFEMSLPKADFIDA